MSWYQCTCGFVTEATPRFGDSIVSMSHLHRAARLDGTSTIVRMEEIPDPALGCEISCVVGSADAHHTPPGASAPVLRSRQAETSRPLRRAA